MKRFNPYKISHRLCSLALIGTMLLGMSPACVLQATAADSGYLIRLTEDAVLTQAQAQQLSEVYEKQNLYHTDDPSVLIALGKDGILEYAEPCVQAELAGGVSANSRQWNLSNEGYGIDVQPAWDAGLSGSGVKIALIDSGVQKDHEDFQGVNIDVGYNVIGKNTDTSDQYGHGTQIAGIIAANAENGIGVQGICDDVSIVPIKCFDSSLTNVKNVIEGIYLAVDTYHCNVINLSLGVSTDTQALRDAVEYAASKNVIVVAAVGNSGETQPEQILYPAAYDCVIGVGAYGPDGSVCPFSHINQSVFVSAPGSEIHSLDRSEPNAYCSLSGTSFAAAHVSALAVIGKTFDPEMTVSEFQELLRNSARDAGVPGYDTSYGYGMICVPNFVEQLGQPPLYFDVKDHWARTNIEYCSELGILSGTDEHLFQPDTEVTRGMAVTALWIMAGKPQCDGTAYSDVSDTAWYAPAVRWASENGIISGYGDGRFGPENTITREQLATIFYGFARYLAIDTSGTVPTGFEDWNTVSSYAIEPLSWAVSHQIMSGKTTSTIAPVGNATRAEFATMICNYLYNFGE